MFNKRYVGLIGAQFVGEGIVQGTKTFDTYRVGPLKGSTVANILIGVLGPVFASKVNVPAEVEDAIVVASARALVEGALGAYEDLTAGSVAPSPAPAKMVYYAPEVYNLREERETKKRSVRIINVD